jgi:hypothetical protein
MTGSGACALVAAFGCDKRVVFVAGAAVGVGVGVGAGFGAVCATGGACVAGDA